MSDLLPSTKLLIFLLAFSIFGLALGFIGHQSRTSDKVLLKDMEDLRIVNAEKVLEEYNELKKEDAEQAQEYLDGVIDSTVYNLSDNEEFMEDNVLLENIDVTDSKDTVMYISYNKYTDLENLEVIKDYMENERSYDTRIIYMTNEESKMFGEFQYVDYFNKSLNEEGKMNYNSVKLPKAFLVIEGELFESFDDYSEMVIMEE